MTSPFISTFPLKEIQIEHITVSYEDSEENLLLYFSKTQAKQFIHFLHEAQIHPKKTYQEVLAWQKQISNNPLLDNLLTFLHLQNKEEKKAEELIIKSYHQYPNYLFAKINYADQCLRQKKLDQIPLIFPTFDLTSLFPKKTKFHVSEFRGFMIWACRYHLVIKKKSLAKNYCQNAYLADPSHPSVVLLEQKFFFKNYTRKSLFLFFKFFKLCRALIIKPWQKRSRKIFP